MGAFVLVRKVPGKDSTALARTATRALSAQGFNSPHVVQTAEYAFYLYKKLISPSENFIELENGNFAAYTGTVIYRGMTGRDALQRLYGDFFAGILHLGSLFGSFCMVLRKGSKTHLFIDRLGIYKVYRESNDLIWTTSFLGVLSCLKHPVINQQCVYEYVFQGATYGNRTVVEDIALLDADRVYELSNRVTVHLRDGLDNSPASPASMDAHLEQNLTNLRGYYRDIARCFGQRIDTALSGGYDSRLTLALLLEQGIKPSVHVYGKSDDADVAIARLIDATEHLGLVHIDKTAFPRVEPEQFAEIVEHNFHAFDGYPTDGVFDHGADLATRTERCRTGNLMLNGGGGEVFRNFFYLPDRRFFIQQFLWTFYSRFDPRTCSRRFSATRYYTELGQKVKQTLGIKTDRLERHQIELLYPLFRCRFWMGKNNSTNNRLGSSLTPFIDYAIVKDAVKIPLQQKNFGKFEARLIEAVNAQLARYPSSYGHSFAGRVPWRRVLEDRITYARPPWLRRYTYRLQARFAKSSVPYVLSRPYQVVVLEDGFPYLSHYFNVGAVRDSSQLNRICTLEFLFQRFDTSMPRENEWGP